MFKNINNWLINIYVCISWIEVVSKNNISIYLFILKIIYVKHKQKI